MSFTVHVDQTFIRDEIQFSVQVITGPEQTWGKEPLSERRPVRWRALLAALADTERPTIIYTMSKADTNALARELSQTFGRCLPYHADLSSDDRREVETEFLEGRCDLIVSTNAFGMGIDKADIRSVIHWSSPASPEALYQEAGRAARGANAKQAKAILLFHEADLDQAYRTLRRDIPVRWEVERVDRVLREMADHQRRTVVTVTDTDLARLAMLRPGLPVHVVMAHLERAGLIKEIDRHYQTVSVRRTDRDAEALTELEAEILGCVDGVDGCVTLSTSALVGLAGTSRPKEVTSAINGLMQRGLIEHCRHVSVRMLEDRPAQFVEDTRSASNRAWKQLALHREQHGATRFHRGLARDDGDAHSILTAVKVMASFGLVEIRSESADGSVLAVRPARDPKLKRLADAFAVSLQLIEVLRSFNTGLPIALHELSLAAGLQSGEVLDALGLLHLIGVASVDLRSWEDMTAADGPEGRDKPDVAREVAIVDVPDRGACLADAVAASVDRARLTKLRLETLRRYAAIEPGDDPDGPDAYQVYLEQYLTEPDFLDRVAADTTAALTEPLTPRQRKIVTEPPTSRIVILAGPGTGKTTTLVTRVAYRVRAGYVLPERILAVTFARAATSEMRARLAQFGVRGVDVRTLDSLAMKIIKDNWSAIGFPALPTLLDGAGQIRLLRELDATANTQQEVKAINLLKARRLPLTEELHLDYQRALANKNLFDFSDAKARATEFLERDTDRARIYLEAYDELFVDEYQDLSPLQIDLVEAISGLAHLTVVGDPRQAIYEWNGANPDALIRMYEQELKAFDLVDNFRSTSNILKGANRIIAHALPQLAPVVSVDGRIGTPTGKHGFNSDEEMLKHVANTVQNWLGDGIPDSEIAVLARTNEMLRTIGQALRDSGIAAHEEGLTHLASTHAFSVLERFGDIGPSTDPDEDEGLLGRVDQVRSLEPVIQLLQGQDPDEAQENADDWERLRAAIDEQRRNGIDELPAALQAIRRSDEGPRNRAGVVVTTMTRSKGLEWDAVAVTHLGAQAMLDSLSQDETCRVVYVSATRARHHLDLSWVGAPTRWLG